MNKYLKMGIGALLGALGGYAYYYFVGCNGSCPLSSNWHVSTLYGAVVGFVLSIPGRKVKHENNAADNN